MNLFEVIIIGGAGLLGAYVGSRLAHKHGGFITLMLLPFFAPVWILEAVEIARGAEQRALRAGRIVAWIAAFCLVGLLNYHWYRESGLYADKIAGAVLTYRSRVGSYPDSLEQAGIPQKDKAASEWMLVYGIVDGKPSLIYAAPFTVFDTYTKQFIS